MHEKVPKSIRSDSYLQAAFLALSTLSNEHIPSLSACIDSVCVLCLCDMILVCGLGTDITDGQLWVPKYLLIKEKVEDKFFSFVDFGGP